MKFNDQNSNFKVKFGISFLENKLPSNAEVTAVIYATNNITPEREEKFQAFLGKLLTCDPEELYLSQVEKSLEEEHSELSRLGFLTMINDYSAKLGWKFEHLNMGSQTITVTTMAQILV